MFSFEILKNYQKGMATYDLCHQSSIIFQWQAFRDEIIEFRENPSLSEFWDILHSLGRVFYKLTGIPLQLLAFPTVIKHSQRYSQRGCVRNDRNCQGKCCSIQSDRA
jgi:hypothetical protein